MKKNKFTLIELLVVIGIIGILIGILLPAISGATKEARVTKAKATIQQIEMACEAYLNEYGTSVIILNEEQNFNDSMRSHLNGNNWRERNFFREDNNINNPWNKPFFVKYNSIEDLIIYTLDSDGERYDNQN